MQVLLETHLSQYTFELESVETFKYMYSGLKWETLLTTD